MHIHELTDMAIKIRDRYSALEVKNLGKAWERGDIARGFMGDVGAAMKLMMAEDGLRTIDDSKAKLEHEMGDILWCVLVLCRKYGVDPEKAFLTTLEELEERITKQENGELETAFSKH